MLPREIYEATKEFNPVFYTESCLEYPTIKEGDAIIDYNDDLALIFENGHYQITYLDWLGSFECSKSNSYLTVWVKFALTV